MEYNYIRESLIFDKTEEEKRSELIKNIILTKELLIQAHKNFEFAESDLIDFYSYNIKANQAKLDYLIKQAKENGIMMDDVRIKNYWKIMIFIVEWKLIELLMLSLKNDYNFKK